LEWRVAVELSGDEVGLDEIINGYDAHEDNRQRFGLPSRLIAKTLLFRILYGGSAYAFANDPAFTGVSKSEKFWQEVIDALYNKYKGLAKWHKGLMEQATLQGKIQVPSGREYTFKPEVKRGELKWPRTMILNYGVQGFSADLVMIARISSWRRFETQRREGSVVFFNSVHDDIEMDCANDPDLLYKVCIEMEQVFADIPKNVEKIYGYKMKVPLAGEVSFGWNLAEMAEFNRDKDEKQFGIK
jgi:DNA polymerase I-like protein with 3'-5' exonuclease and polymerase domains